MGELELGDIHGQRPETASYPKNSGDIRLARITQDSREGGRQQESTAGLGKCLRVSCGPSAWLRGQMAVLEAT